ncbi:hypothetical protein PIB30_046222 [Stylosanthes scabra]|uniref:Pollen Ole e 1 allergen and extensin family protein n=1 Tax=Stylosanthes scabra TaxID=79078 RepID=A0ABU6RH25_9FABA|nr:hypothetical protein [Stylosanthes scabra]
MAYAHHHQVITLVLLFALALIRIHPSACQQIVEGKVSCLDCTHHYHFSDIKVSVKCQGVNKLAMATTQDDGSFKLALPSSSSSVNNCMAKILGGPVQLYASRKKQVSEIVKGKDKNMYTISAPLSFMTSRPNKNQLGSSKTVDLPLPPEWGLAPSSYYVPFIPIIGIP